MEVSCSFSPCGSHSQLTPQTTAKLYAMGKSDRRVQEVHSRWLELAGAERCKGLNDKLCICQSQVEVIKGDMLRGK